jgi:transposase
VLAKDGVHLTQQVHTMVKQDTQPKPARRQYTAAFKHDLVQRCLRLGASVSGIALDNGINANVLFRWRREHLRGTARAQARSGAAAAVLLPVNMAALSPGEPSAPRASMATPAGVIEIDIGAARVRLRGPVDEASVRCVLQTLGALA